MTKKKQNFFEGAFILTLAIAVAKFVGFLYRIPLYNIIEEDGIGFYSYAYNIYSVIYSITVTGFPTAVSKIVAQYASEGRYRDVRRTVKVSRLFLGILGAVSALIMIAAAKPYCTLKNNFYAYLSLIALGPSLIFSCFMVTHRGYNQGMADMTPTAVSQVVEVIVKALTGLAGSYAAKAYFTAEYMRAGTVLGEVQENAAQALVSVCALSAAGAMLGVTFSTFAGWIYFVIRSGRQGDGITAEDIAASPEPDSGKAILKSVLAVGLPIAFSAAAVSLTGLIDNETVISRLASCLSRDSAALFASHGGILETAEKNLEDIPNYLYGVYNIGMPLFNLVPTITGTFGISVLPHITTAWQRKDIASARQNMERALKLTTLVAAPAGFGIAFLAGPLAKLLFPAREIGVVLTAPMLTVLGIAAVFVGISGIINSMLQAVGRVRIPLLLMILGGAVKLTSNFLLIGIPKFNIKAAPFGNLFCYSLIVVLGLIILFRSTGIRINLAETMIKPMISGLAAGGAARLVYTLVAVTGRTRVATLLGLIAAVLAYVVMLAVFGLITEDEAMDFPGGKFALPVLKKLKIVRR